MTMSHRQHIALRELREMREQEERAARELEAHERAERERPLKEAEEAYKATVQELGKTIRERIATQKDDEVFVDPETATARMPWSEATEYNRKQIDTFKSQNPSAYWSEKNVDIIHDYFERNGLQIISAKTLKAAWERLSLYGLLETAPVTVAEPISEPTHRPVQREVPAPEPETFEGWDPDSGARRIYSRWDVDRMTGDEYRRAFRIYKEALKLPTRPAF